MATATRVSMGMGEAVSSAPQVLPDTQHGSRAVPAELVRALNAPLPAEAIKPHPTKDYLSSVKAIYVIERLNEVFGIGGWTYRTSVTEQGTPTLVPDDRKPGVMKEKPGMIVMHVVFQVPAYGIRLEQYGGSDNPDRGDAYKGAVTDALSKCASYLGIAMDVYKGGGPTKQNPRGIAVAPRPKYTPAQVKVVTAKLARQPAAALVEQIPETYYEDAPEDEQPTIEEQLQYSIQAAREKRLEAFGIMQRRHAAVGFPQTFGAQLGQFGVRVAAEFPDTQEGIAQAAACFAAMRADVAKREARGQ